MKHYNVNGVRLFQDELTLEEFERIKKILGDKRNVFQGDEQKIGEYIDALFDAGLIHEMIPTILKFHEPTIVHRWMNAWRMRRLGVDKSTFVKTMKGTHIAKVIVDFFLLNIAWTSNLLVLPTTSDSESATTMEPNRTRFKNWFSSWRNPTPSVPTQSGK